MAKEQGANAEQIQYWNEVSGPKWAVLGDRIDAQIAHLGRSAMDRAELRPGDHVLDIGCGCGLTTLDLAERVGPSGSVLGVDVSNPMLDVARSHADRSGAKNVAWLQADAQVHAFEPHSRDVAFSRFGVMFFEDPTKAFQNVRAALKPGGRLAFACWQAIDRNPWMLVPILAAAAHVPLPAPPPVDAPGPFAFADPEHVRTLLAEAGFVDVSCDSLETRIAIGRELGVEEAADFALQMGPVGALLREADETVRRATRQAVLEALGPYTTDEGRVELDGAVWIVTATA